MIAMVYATIWNINIYIYIYKRYYQGDYNLEFQP